ncbi:hypothetical protein CP8484711_0601B, partial [Chlamydia psittaci 84-8471/1]
ETFL